MDNKTAETARASFKDYSIYSIKGNMIPFLESSLGKCVLADTNRLLASKDARIRELEAENERLKADKNAILADLNDTKDVVYALNKRLEEKTELCKELAEGLEDISKVFIDNEEVIVIKKENQFKASTAFTKASEIITKYNNSFKI